MIYDLLISFEFQAAVVTSSLLSPESNLTDIWHHLSGLKLGRASPSRCSVHCGTCSVLFRTTAPSSGHTINPQHCRNNVRSGETRSVYCFTFVLGFKAPL